MSVICNKAHICIGTGCRHKEPHEKGFYCASPSAAFECDIINQEVMCVEVEDAEV